MVKPVRVLACSLLLAGSANVHAQQAGQCPQLPAGSGLQWEQQAQSGFVLCKAATEDGRTVLNLMLTERDPSLALNRSLRAEKGSFSGEELYWYHPDMGGRDLPGTVGDVEFVAVLHEQAQQGHRGMCFAADQNFLPVQLVQGDARKQKNAHDRAA